MAMSTRTLHSALLLLIAVGAATLPVWSADVTSSPTADHGRPRSVNVSHKAAEISPRSASLSRLRPALKPSSPRGGVFPGTGSARATDEYYSYEYSAESLAVDNNGSGGREAVSWIVPDPDTLAAAEEPSEEDVEEELPDNSLADGDLHDHDMMDSVMYIYFGPSPRSDGGVGGQVVLAGAAVALFAQALTALAAVRKAVKARCRTPTSAADSRGSVHAALVLLHTELAMASTSLVILLAAHATSDPARCQAVALLLHYLHLSAACWLTANCLRVFLWLAQEASPPHERATPRAPGLQALAVAAWAAPLLLVLASFLAHPQGYETRHYCWLSIQKGMLVSYLAPVAALITASTVLAVLGVRRAPHKVHGSAAEDAARLALRLSSGVIPLFAVVWFFSVLALEQPQSLAAALLYAASSALLNWFLFACSNMVFPDCPVMPVRTFHPLALTAGAHCTLMAHHPSAPPSPSDHDAQPLLPSVAPACAVRWSEGWTPRTHPEIASPTRRVVTWREREEGSGDADEGEIPGASTPLNQVSEELLEPGSELLELRFENISTIST